MWSLASYRASLLTWKFSTSGSDALHCEAWCAAHNSRCCRGVRVFFFLPSQDAHLASWFCSRSFLTRWSTERGYPSACAFARAAAGDPSLFAACGDHLAAQRFRQLLPIAHCRTAQIIDGVLSMWSFRQERGGSRGPQRLQSLRVGRRCAPVFLNQVGLLLKNNFSACN